MKKIILIILILLLLLSFTTAKAQMWKDVGSPILSTAMTDYVTEVIDSKGLPYIGYADWAYGARITVQHFDGVSWNIVGDPGFSPQAAFDKQIALSPKGVPYVVFVDITSVPPTIVMKFDGTSWVQVGPAVTLNGMFPSIDIASDGTPYVTLQIDFTPYVKTFKFDGTSWVQVGLPYSHPTTTFEWPHIKIGKNDTPFVSMVNANTPGGPITVMKFNGMVWASVDSAGVGPGNGLYVALAVDSVGIPYVAFEDTDNGGKATVKKYIGGRWTPVGNIGFSAGQSGLIDLVISKKQQPYVCFSDGAVGEKVTAMTCIGGKWITIGYPGFSNEDAWACIGVDTIGVPYVFYTEGHAGRQAFVRRPELSPITGNDTVCKGRDVTESQLVSGGTWTSSNTAKAIVSTTGKVSGLDTGTVTITYTVPSIPAVLRTIKIKDCRLDVPPVHNISVTIFPNPANDGLNVTGVTNTSNYRLLNFTGIAVRSGILQPGNNAIDISSLSLGVYILEMTDRDGSRKIMRVSKE